jgi:uncharacterized membrane protein
MSQRRKDELSELREELTLQLAIVTDQKGAKIVSLIEEMRRDSPQLMNRADVQAEAMSAPTDPEAMAEATKETKVVAATLIEGDSTPPSA